MVTIDLGSCPDPSAVFARLRAHPGAFWIDRRDAGERAILGCSPIARFSVEGDGRVKLADANGAREIPGDPLAAAEEFVAAAPSLAPGGVPHTVGAFAYEMGALVEERSRTRHVPDLPLAVLARYDAVVACEPDPWSEPRSWQIRVHASDPGAAERIGLRVGPAPFDVSDVPAAGTAPRPAARLLESPCAGDYVRAVRHARRYIEAGDVYQVNLARRFRVGTTEDPADVYLRLRAEQAVGHGSFLACGDFSLLCNSPERFVRVGGDEIRTEPIKGTRPRDPDPERDTGLRAELLASAKERAEHVMIVDLERNDLGRVCVPGSVEVPSLLRVESFATLHHLVSTVRGRLRPDAGLAAILRATFPGGSITGAPKIRASQVIAELEPIARGFYTGAIAWFEGPRRFDSAIAIRTAIARNRELSYHVGAGIVADSDPERELAECWLKARPFLRATLGAAEAASCATVPPRPPMRGGRAGGRSPARGARATDSRPPRRTA